MLKRILLDEKKCIMNCSESQYKYEYYDICYMSCPNTTQDLDNDHICKDSPSYHQITENTIMEEIISSISTESKNIINNINDILSNFTLDNFFKGEYEITNQTSEIKDIIIKKINEAILNGQIDFSNIINGENNNLVMEDNNIIYEITTSKIIIVIIIFQQ